MRLWKIALGFILIKVILLVGFFTLFMKLDQRFALLAIAGSGVSQAGLIVAAWSMMEREHRRGKSKHWLNKQRLKSEKRQTQTALIVVGLVCVGRIIVGFYQASQAGWTRATTVIACLWAAFALSSLYISVSLNRLTAGLKKAGFSKTYASLGSAGDKQGQLTNEDG